MHTNKPVTRSTFGAAQGMRLGLQVFLMLLLGAGMMCVTALAAQAPGAKTADAPAMGAAQATFVGAETCATCHEEVAKGFASNPHTKMVLMHDSNGMTCENCHGAGSEHVAGGGDVTKIFDPLKATPKQINDTCQKCHANTHPDYMRGPHAKAGLSCISCHSVHGGNVQLPGQPAAKAALKPVDAAATAGGDYREKLLKAPQPTLCFQCHTDVKPQFGMPFHHPVNEGVVKCTDCHDVHGTFGINNLRSTEDQNMICTKCHTDKRGPFVFEHAPVKAQGCLACHSDPPHGSQNPRMLSMPEINVLCVECHGQPASAAIHGLSPASSDSVPCTSCHTYIHGSNMNAAFLR
jgi:predicted CXXCH cytochrome family protein